MRLRTREHQFDDGGYDLLPAFRKDFAFGRVGVRNLFLEPRHACLSAVVGWGGLMESPDVKCIYGLGFREADFLLEDG